MDLSKDKMCRNPNKFVSNEKETFPTSTLQSNESTIYFNDENNDIVLDDSLMNKTIYFDEESIEEDISLFIYKQYKEIYHTSVMKLNGDFPNGFVITSSMEEDRYPTVPNNSAENDDLKLEQFMVKCNVENNSPDKYYINQEKSNKILELSNANFENLGFLQKTFYCKGYTQKFCKGKLRNNCVMADQTKWNTTKDKSAMGINKTYDELLGESIKLVSILEREQRDTGQDETLFDDLSDGETKSFSTGLNKNGLQYSGKKSLLKNTGKTTVHNSKIRANHGLNGIASNKILHKVTSKRNTVNSKQILENSSQSLNKLFKSFTKKINNTIANGQFMKKEKTQELFRKPEKTGIWERRKTTALKNNLTKNKKVDKTTNKKKPEEEKSGKFLEKNESNYTKKFSNSKNPKTNCNKKVDSKLLEKGTNSLCNGTPTINNKKKRVYFIVQPQNLDNFFDEKKNKCMNSNFRSLKLNNSDKILSRRYTKRFNKNDPKKRMYRYQRYLTKMKEANKKLQRVNKETRVGGRCTIKQINAFI